MIIVHSLAASKELKKSTVINLNGVKIGGKEIAIFIINTLTLLV